MWCALVLQRFKNGRFHECCLTFFIIFGNAGLAKVLENGLWGWWRMLMNQKNVIVEAKHPCSFFLKCGVG
jgi:hypothetical protein